ncbi:MAG TPA: radical SAM family heme chaperone HemW [Gemmatimonadaceae bacterium]
MPPSHLYVHVPFCARRCSYCDFSIAVRARTPVHEYVQALRSELTQGPIDDATLDTVYLGGGTPSRLGGPGVAQVLAAIRERATIANDAEVTIEANPDDVNDIAVAQWLAAGVSRISLGAQSFNDSVLEWMHRSHDSSQIARAVKAIKRGGIDNISVDLIFALPAHLSRDWNNDVDRALGLMPAHVSLYGLTVEAHTPIARWADRGAVVEGSEDQYEEEFLHANETMSAAGFDHYEVSNFSLPGKASRHNSAYWTGAPYAGVGPSAHSFDGATRRWNVAAYAEWVRRLSNSEPTLGGEELLTDENRDAEEVYLGLRTRRGLEIGEHELSVAELWRSAGWAEIEPDVPGNATRVLRRASSFPRTLRLTSTGWLRLDSLAADLAARRSNRPSPASIATPSHCYI